MTLTKLLVLMLSSALLAACGGGGSDASTPTVTDFPLLAGYKALTAAGASNNYVVAGSCSGSATIADSAAVAATFEGVNGYATTSTATLTVPNCIPASSSTTSTNYYDINYAPLGDVAPGSDYAKALAVPPQLPASVKVGDTGTYVTLTVYADSTKVAVLGSRVFSYVVEHDTASTAIINLIAKEYDTSNSLLSTQQSRYRIAANGTLTSTTIDYRSGTVHLLFTKV